MRERLDHGLNLVKFFFFAKLTKRLLGGARINFNEGQGVVWKVTRGPNCIVIFITSEEFRLWVDFTKVRAVVLEHLSLFLISFSSLHPLHRVSNLRFVKILSILRSTGPSLPPHPHILMWPGETCPTSGSGGGRGGWRGSGAWSLADAWLAGSGRHAAAMLLQGCQYLDMYFTILHSTKPKWYRSHIVS